MTAARRLAYVEHALAGPISEARRQELEAKAAQYRRSRVSEGGGVKDRCAGGVVAIDAFKQPYSPGWWKANCPTCGRWVAFHWATGRFKAHSLPRPS